MIASDSLPSFSVLPLSFRQEVRSLKKALAEAKKTEGIGCPNEVRQNISDAVLQIAASISALLQSNRKEAPIAIAVIRGVMEDAFTFFERRGTPRSATALLEVVRSELPFFEKQSP